MVKTVEFKGYHLRVTFSKDDGNIEKAEMLFNDIPIVVLTKSDMKTELTNEQRKLIDAGKNLNPFLGLKRVLEFASQSGALANAS